MHFNGQKFSVVLEQFSITPKFWVKKAKIHLFKKNGFELSFIKVKCMPLQTGLLDLKNTKQLKFLLMVDSLRIFKSIVFFKFFRDF